MNVTKLVKSIWGVLFIAVIACSSLSKENAAAIKQKRATEQAKGIFEIDLSKQSAGTVIDSKTELKKDLSSMVKVANNIINIKEKFCLLDRGQEYGKNAKSLLTQMRGKIKELWGIIETTKEHMKPIEGAMSDSNITRFDDAKWLVFDSLNTLDSYVPKTPSEFLIVDNKNLAIEKEKEKIGLLIKKMQPITSMFKKDYPATVAMKKVVITILEMIKGMYGALDKAKKQILKVPLNFGPVD